MKVLVALSGGVDSSVVACLMHQAGHEVIGVMMKLWSDPLPTTMRRALPQKCCSVEHIQRARQVCAMLDIPFYVVNLEDEFKKDIVDPWLEGYQRGTTPNPCIQCNRLIKFGKLLEKADELGCDMIATGHYVQTKTVDGMIELHQAVDETRDQSYYLYTLNQVTLKRCLFPLGDKLKSEVFELAKQFEVPIPDTYRESEDLCFYPEREPGDFLRRYLDMETGDIVNEESGETVGTHQGLPLYTIGQRKGLNIGGLKIPLHVTKKDVGNNTLYVKEAGKDLESNLVANNIHWIAGTLPDMTGVTARISSLGEKRTGSFVASDDHLECTFIEPVRGIAPGQSVVLYKGNQVLGGGIIAQP